MYIFLCCDQFSDSIALNPSNYVNGNLHRITQPVLSLSRHTDVLKTTQPLLSFNTSVLRLLNFENLHKFEEMNRNSAFQRRTTFSQNRLVAQKKKPEEVL